jgi:hypothetical protein
MHLDHLIHGLFITSTQFRLLLHSCPAIIIMYIYNWYHSDITGIHYIHEYIKVHHRAIPLLSAFPYFHSLLLPFRLPYLLGTLLAVIGSRPPRSQVACKLIFPFQNPDPPGSPRSKYTFIRTTLQTWLTRSSTETLTHAQSNFLKVSPVKSVVSACVPFFGG